LGRWGVGAFKAGTLLPCGMFIYGVGDGDRHERGDGEGVDRTPSQPFAASGSPQAREQTAKTDHDEISDDGPAGCVAVVSVPAVNDVENGSCRDRADHRADEEFTHRSPSIPVFRGGCDGMHGEAADGATDRVAE